MCTGCDCPRDEAHKGVKEGEDHPTRSVQTFVQKCIPCLVSQTNLSCKAAHSLIYEYEELRSVGATQGEVLSLLTKNHKLMRKVGKGYGGRNME